MFLIKVNKLIVFLFFFVVFLKEIDIMFVMFLSSFSSKFSCS